MVEAGVGVALLTVGLLIVAIVVIKSKSLFKPKTGQMSLRKLHVGPQLNRLN